MTLYGGFVRVIIWSVVRVVTLKKSDALLLLALLDGLLFMTAGLLVNLAMMTDTYRHEIVWIKTDAGHSRFALVNHRLDGHDVMDVHRQCVDASPPLAVAYLTVALRLSELPRSQFFPPIRVQQSLVSFISAHIVSSIQSLTSSRMSSKVMANW